MDVYESTDWVLCEFGGQEQLDRFGTVSSSSQGIDRLRISRSQSCRVGMWASEGADKGEFSDRCAAYFVGVLPNDLVVAEGLILNPSSNARPGW